MARKRLNFKRLCSGETICMIAGIFVFVMFVDLGEGMLAGGTECGLGAGAGIAAFHAGKYLFFSKP